MSAKWRARLALAALLALAATLSIWVEIRSQELQPASPIPAVDNPGPAGLEAAYLYLREHELAGIWESGSLPADARTLISALPYAREYDDDERRALWKWIEQGGTLVVLGHHERDLGSAVGNRLSPPSVALQVQGRQVGISEIGQDVRAMLEAATRPVSEEVIPARPAVPDPINVGIKQLAVSSGHGFEATSGDAVPLVLAGDTPVVLSLPFGKGRLIALAGPDALANARIDLGDNLRLLTNIASLDGKVYFDEEHHRPAPSVALSELTRWLGPPVVQLLLLGAAILLATWRRLGPVRQRSAMGVRPPSEYASQLGALYRRAHAEPSLSAELYQDLRRRLETRLGLARTLSDLEVEQHLRERSPGLGAQYAQVAREAKAISVIKAQLSPERFAAHARSVAEFELRL
jgi:hypothetical protein